MKRFALFLLAALSLPLAARADEANRRAKAHEMLVIFHAESSTRQVAENFILQADNYAKNMVGANPTLAGQTSLAELHRKVAALINGQLDWKTLEPLYIDLYLKTFTEQELDAIVAFCKTPAGIAMLEKLPQVNAQAGKLGQERLATVQPQVRQLMEDLHKSISTPAPAPAKP